MVTKLHFPQEEAVAAYLRSHPETKGYNPELLTKIAKVFAEQVLTTQGTQLFIALMLFVYQKELGLEKVDVLKVQSHFAAALIDCVHQKPLGLVAKL